MIGFVTWPPLLKIVLVSNFLASADIRVFGRTCLFAMLLLIGLALFYTPGVVVISSRIMQTPHINSELHSSVLVISTPPVFTPQVFLYLSYVKYVYTHVKLLHAIDEV